MNKRLKNLKEYMQENSLDSLIITDRKNMQYFTSYTGEGYMLITHGKNYLFTDSRYTCQAAEQTEDVEICNVADVDLADAFGGYKRTGFENTSISYRSYNSFGKMFKDLVPIDGTILNMRAVKDAEEIENIRMAEHIGDMAFEHILPYIKPGVSERDIALEIEYFMKKNGAEGLSFDTIVATGSHGALPHAEPEERLIKKGDFVTMDFGCVYKGYSGDMTRTVCVGKATDEMKKVYNTVLKAQLSSLEMLMAGVNPAEVHKNAQRIIDENYKGMFGHGLGHGVGLDVHENPSVSPKNTNPLENGNVVTVEPGIYIPGFGGVRIEDLVVIEDKSIINLTKSPKDLMEI